jgi:NAD kinase
MSKMVLIPSASNSCRMKPLLEQMDEVMHEIRRLGMVLHLRRDSAEAVTTILGGAADRDVTVFGLADEIGRLDCTAVAVTAEAMAAEADLLMGLGGDGTVLRATRLSDPYRAPVLGVKLGFLAEVDIPGPRRRPDRYRRRELPDRSPHRPRRRHRTEPILHVQ